MYKCAGGYEVRGGRCVKVTGKAPGLAKKAVFGNDYKATKSAMVSNEARAEVRGSRKPSGVSARGSYMGQVMHGDGGSGGAVRGGSDNPWTGKKHGDRYLNRSIPSGPRMSIVSGGTGHGARTPGDNTIVTDPQMGKTPEVRSRKKSYNESRYSGVMNSIIRNSGEHMISGYPSNRGTGGGPGYYNPHKDTMSGALRPSGNQRNVEFMHKRKKLKR